MTQHKMLVSEGVNDPPLLGNNLSEVRSPQSDCQILIQHPNNETMLVGNVEGHLVLGQN